ncbi:hypothetical protein B4O97_01720 [Marispirochaeta aestuarii]|uniref:Uncharacterized protein n=1 Tax=Marispirochaeta aestuarii TaxID=1963862 RepID=A0A1Y1S1Q4_9SPIO|nr:hypothetical protein [Marispirochaeta aestuarii]ORC37744.1 hypothetical protein B4O97_01720 [Marispirochaeta aestuarii]
MKTDSGFKVCSKYQTKLRMSYHSELWLFIVHGKIGVGKKNVNQNIQQQKSKVVIWSNNASTHSQCWTNTSKHHFSHADVEKVRYTRMLIIRQSNFKISYIVPERHDLRSYYSDFSIHKKDGAFLIVEVNSDNMLSDPIVQMKIEYSFTSARINDKRYKMSPVKETEPR